MASLFHCHLKKFLFFPPLIVFSLAWLMEKTLGDLSASQPSTLLLVPAVVCAPSPKKT